MTSARSDGASLLFRARGDTDDARKAFRELKADIKDTSDAAGKDGVSGLEKFGQSIGLSESKAASLATALPIVGTAAVAMGAAIVAGAVTGAKALFDLARGASDFGSEIYDASVKTGLHAETLSSMKFAADQSGTSLDQVTGAIGKFAKQVGAAAEGSKEAAADLKALGIDPQEALSDLDTALAKVFKRIIEAKPGIDQMTLAQKAFGKSGADLLPFIESFDGNLEKLIKRAKELGVTINNEASKAADEFGDSLNTLDAQFAGIGRTIGFVFMPVFTDMARALSQFLVQNQENFEAWANTAKQALLGLSQTFGAFEDRLDEFKQRTGKSWTDIATDMLDKTGPLMIRMGELQKLLGGAATGGVGYSSPYAREGGGFATMSAGDTTGTRASRGRGVDPAKEADRAESERIAQIRRNLADEISLRLATDAKERESIELKLDKEVISTQEAFDKIQQLVWDQMQFKIDAYEEALKSVQGNVEEEERLNRELKVMWQEFHTLSIKQAREKIDFEKKSADEQEKLFRAELDRQKQLTQADQERLVIEQRRLDLLQEQQRTAPAPGYESRPALGYEGDMATAPGTLVGGIADSLGADLVPMFDSVTNAMLSFQERLALVSQDINSFVGGAIGNMINGLAQMGVAWLSTGKFSAKAALQMLASVAMSIAAQAAIKAVFEAAEAVAAAARWDFVSAGLHSTAAGMYATVAVIAGAAGVGLALASRAFGNGGGQTGREAFSSASSGAYGSRDTENAQNDPLVFTETFNGYVRQQNERMAEQIERQNVVLGGVMEVVGELGGKVKAMSPGHVLGIGAEENPEAIRTAFEAELGSDLRASTNFFRQTGQYR